MIPEICIQGGKILKKWLRAWYKNICTLNYAKDKISCSKCASLGEVAYEWIKNSVVRLSSARYGLIFF